MDSSQSWLSGGSSHCQVRIQLSHGRLIVRDHEIRLRTHSLAFSYRKAWRCRLAIDADGSQGLIAGWQRMVCESVYASTPYGATYASPGHYASGAEAAQRSPVAEASNDNSTAGEAKVSTPLSRAFVTFVGTNERGTSRLIYVSKIQRLGLALDAIDLDRGWVTFQFRPGQMLAEMIDVYDGSAG